MPCDGRSSAATLPAASSMATGTSAAPATSRARSPPRRPRSSAGSAARSPPAPATSRWRRASTRTVCPVSRPARVALPPPHGGRGQARGGPGTALSIRRGSPPASASRSSSCARSTGLSPRPRSGSREHRRELLVQTPGAATTRGTEVPCGLERLHVKQTTRRSARAGSGGACPRRRAAAPAAEIPPRTIAANPVDFGTGGRGRLNLNKKPGPC